MDARNPCNCELCNPNWHLGEADVFPLTEEELAALARAHAEKVEAAGYSAAPVLVEA
jgi:hypothetical protein